MAEAALLRWILAQEKTSPSPRIRPGLGKEYQFPEFLMAGLIGLIEGSAFFMSGRHGLVSKEHGAANGQDPIIWSEL